MRRIGGTGPEDTFAATTIGVWYSAVAAVGSVWHRWPVSFCYRPLPKKLGRMAAVCYDECALPTLTGLRARSEAVVQRPGSGTRRLRRVGLEPVVSLHCFPCVSSALPIDENARFANPSHASRSQT